MMIALQLKKSNNMNIAVKKLSNETKLKIMR